MLRSAHEYNGEHTAFRTERRDLQRHDKPYLSQPLHMGGDPRSMAAHLRYVVQALRSPTSKSPSSDAVAHIGALHDRTVPKQTEKMLACRKGCSHCCSQWRAHRAGGVLCRRAIAQAPETSAAVAATAP